MSQPRSQGWGRGASPHWPHMGQACAHCTPWCSSHVPCPPWLGVTPGPHCPAQAFEQDLTVAQHTQLVLTLLHSLCSHNHLRCDLASKLLLMMFEEAGLKVEQVGRPTQRPRPYRPYGPIHSRREGARAVWLGPGDAVSGQTALGRGWRAVTSAVAGGGSPAQPVPEATRHPPAGRPADHSEGHDHPGQPAPPGDSGGGAVPVPSLREAGASSPTHPITCRDAERGQGWASYALHSDWPDPWGPAVLLGRSGCLTPCLWATGQLREAHLARLPTQDSQAP